LVTKWRRRETSDYEREIGHAGAEKNAAYLAALRVRIAKKGLKARS
jgi:hypothetical protein